ncbi:MAG: hypothetical protein ACRDGT_01140 [Candidatus Limnocylindria bacterium]
MGLTGHALSTGGFEAALIAFVAAAAVLAALVFGFAFVVARAQETTVQAIRARAGQVKRYGGYVLIAVGLWSIALAVLAEFFAQYFLV